MTTQGHSLYQVWTLWDHSFLSYAADKHTGLECPPTPTDMSALVIITDGQWAMRNVIVNWNNTAYTLACKHVKLIVAYR